MSGHKVPPIVGGQLLRFAVAEAVDGVTIKRRNVMNRAAIPTLNVTAIIHIFAARPPKPQYRSSATESA